MKSLGIVRKVDELGWIVIPIELRRTLSIDIKDPLEIFVEGENIILRGYNPLCYFCSGSDDLKDFKGKQICSNCRNTAKELL